MNLYSSKFQNNVTPPIGSQKNKCTAMEQISLYYIHYDVYTNFQYL